MEQFITLQELAFGEKGRVKEIYLDGKLRRRLQDMGLTRNAVVECLSESPSGDPRAYAICGAVIALRNRDSMQVLLEQIGDGKHAT